MNPLPFLAGTQRVFIEQRKEWTEVLVDWETRNQYVVATEDGESIAHIAEKSGGFLDHAKRFFLRSHRGFEVGIFDLEGIALLFLRRGFFLVFSDLEVARPGGEIVGLVKRRWGVLYRNYDLVDAHGRVFAHVKGPRWRIWTFPVLGKEGRHEATISKKWGGLLKEAFADADTFGIDFQGPEWSDEERAVIFAAALSIDFDFFENNQGDRGGILGN